MTAIPIPDLTLPQMVRERARATPDRVALRQKEFGIWRPYSWKDYETRARHFALGLDALGIGAGGKVGVLSENRVEWVVAQIGAGMIGAATVGVYATSPTPEVAYIVAHGDIEVIVCEDQEQTDKVLAARGELPHLRRIIAIEMRGMGDYPADLVVSFESVEALGAAHADPALVDRRLDAQRLDDLALLIYTSGSTGRPKGAMITYAGIHAGMPALLARTRMDARSVSLSYLPLCHVAEQLFTTFGHIYAGSLVNFGESLRTVQSDLREIAPTVFLGVPRIWEKLHAAIHIKALETGGLRRTLFDRAFALAGPIVAKPAARRTAAERATYALCHLLVFRALQNFIGLRRCRVAASGAAPIPPEVFRFFQVIGVPIIEAYGATEASGLIACHEPGDVRTGTVGRAVDGLELRLAEDGEILIRGAQLFAGYYKNAEATAQSMADGWYHTGDVGRIEDGHLRIADRKRDIMITAGGKNLAPSEIEHAVKASPFVKECIVIGEGRRYVSALVQIEFDTVSKWAEERGLAYTTYRSLAEHPDVVTLVQREVDRANATMADVAHVRRFRLLTKELDHDDDELTATMKIRRGNIHKKYAEQIESLY